MPVLRRLTWGAQGRQLAVSSASRPSVGCRCGWGGWRHSAEDYTQSCGFTMQVAVCTVHSASRRFLKPVCMGGRCVWIDRKGMQLVSMVCYISGIIHLMCWIADQWSCGKGLSCAAARALSLSVLPSRSSLTLSQCHIHPCTLVGLACACL